MNNLSQTIEYTEKSKKLFPKQGFTWFIPMARGRYEFLEMIVKRQEDKIPITQEMIISLYKEKVCRGDYKKNNIRPWLLRTIGALVLDGFLTVSTKLNKQIMEELKKINSENILIEAENNIK